MKLRHPQLRHATVKIGEGKGARTGGRDPKLVLGTESIPAPTVGAHEHDSREIDRAVLPCGGRDDLHRTHAPAAVDHRRVSASAAGDRLPCERGHVASQRGRVIICLGILPHVEPDHEDAGIAHPVADDILPSGPSTVTGAENKDRARWQIIRLVKADRLVSPGKIYGQPRHGNIILLVRESRAHREQEERKAAPAEE